MKSLRSFSLFLFMSFLSVQAFGKLSASDLVSKIDAGQVTFQRGAMANLPQALTDRMIEINRARYPNFRPSMWYYHFVEINDVGYYVSYDWGASECNFTWIDLSAAAKQKGAPQIKQSGGTISDSHKETLPTRVCEKLYNFYSK